MIATGYRATKVLWLFTMAALLSSASVPAAMASDDPDNVSFTLQSYMWLPTIEGELKYTTRPNGSSGSPEIEVDADDLLENLDMAVLLTAEARKGKWSFVADFTYLDVSSSQSAVKGVNFGGNLVTTTLNIETEVETKGFCTTFVGGYRVIDGQWLKTDLVAGARYLWLEAEVSWDLSGTVSGPSAGQTFARTGNLKEDEDVWNGVGGVRGQVNLGGSHWFIPYYADIGSGDCDLTWQVFSALGYSFKGWDIALGYRHLAFEGDDDSLLQELSFSGPVLGARFSF